MEVAATASAASMAEDVASAASMRGVVSEADTVISAGITAATGTTATADITAAATDITALVIMRRMPAPLQRVQLSASSGLPSPGRLRVTEIDDKGVGARRKGAKGRRRAGIWFGPSIRWLNVSTRAELISAFIGSVSLEESCSVECGRDLVPSAHGSADGRSGPAEGAVTRWFTTDRSLNCYDRRGNRSGCRLDEDSHVIISYAPSGSTAVAFATYVNDPTGNAEMFAAAVFHKEQDGWRIVRTVPNLTGKSATNVAFKPGSVSFDTEFWRENDSHCCPTGRKRWTVSLP